MVDATSPITPTAVLNVENFDSSGSALTDADICGLVTNTKKASEEYIVQEKWKLMWGDSNTLYNAPRPLSMYNGSYVLEPDTQRFTMAQDENSITPHFTKALFYQDPPIEVRPGAGMTQEDAMDKMWVVGHFLGEMKFQRGVEWALESMTHQGTCVVEWGIEFKPKCQYKRRSKVSNIPSNMGATDRVYSDAMPDVEEDESGVEVCFTFENVPVTEIFPDPKNKVPDIRESGAVVRARTVDFYGLQSMRNDKTYTGIPGDATLKTWFMPNVLPVAQIPAAEQLTVKRGVINTGQSPTVQDPNPLRKKVDMLIYWDCENTYTVVGDNHLIRKMKNPYKQHPFLSANYWNCPNAFYGMGVGRLAGSDQRLETGSVNTALKILAMKTNTPYLRQGDANMPNQMIMTGLGRILSVADITKAYALLPTPEVPPDLFAVLQDARNARQAATGADSMLVSGSSAGEGRMSTKSSGAVSAIAGAGATKLDGPLGRFINQIFVPFIHILDDLIYRYVSDQKIVDILGKKKGKDYLAKFDIDRFHEMECEYDVLAGAKLAARAGMAQALIILFQFLENPQLLENLADINDEQVNLKPLLKIAFHAYQFGSGIENDIFIPLTTEKKQQRQAQATGQGKLQQQVTLANQKYQQKSALQEQGNNERIQRDIVRDAFKKAGLSEAETGEPGGGFETEE